ncbi:UvrD-helicase domain-containing protein [Brevibacillus panacihumi]|uniref:Uncharacterized protein n=1 Tax=Brevibacillus panacihumi TaxID=497735 RepID=A0A3M8C4U7_9BACL|nr:UvrD-helicase domain-containing protein [Brevibacillus panacihumi]RNB70407.1 hypothetical protein EDM58_23250 [Brevibacillus panacihumi]
MRIIVAGAGAGKTTSMAQKVLDRFKEVTNGKIIYVITYTNAARDRIREKIIELNGAIPKQLLIETSHAFLLREVIFPFHHLLYEEQYTIVSQIKLPDNSGFKAMKIRELQKKKIIHVEKVTETAKWIISGKSRDTKAIKDKRKKILLIIQRYLDSVFIDEAQDMDDHLVKIIEVLDNMGIKLNLVGDPKQDLRGRNDFSELIEKFKEHVEYKTENYRCPISHVNLANVYISEEEKQIPKTLEVGQISYVFESDTDVVNFIKDSKLNQVFIYKKNERFTTQPEDQNKTEQNLSHELQSLVKKSGFKESEINQAVYMLKKEVLKEIQKSTNSAIFKKLEELLSIKLTKIDMGKLGEALKMYRDNRVNSGILVQTIDKVKGLEGEICLFILTTDLAPYLFVEKVEKNKMLNYLYVALTRAKKELRILVTQEVEEKYGRQPIKEKFQTLLKK